jgi:hypothetical protein
MVGWKILPAAFGLTVIASTAFAQDEERMQWRGRVDGIDEIDIRGDRIKIRHLEALPIEQQDHRFTAPLPREEDLDLRLRTIAGRGEVTLVEEPSARNDYTATIRVEDQAPGADDYEFELVWEEDRWDGDDRWDDDFGGFGDERDPFGDEDGVFRWAGRVDIGADIEIRGGRHQIEDRGGSGTQERDARFDASLPRREIEVSLRKVEGRGLVELVQSPSGRNDYTAVVRILDEESGADEYEFELRWRR